MSRGEAVLVTGGLGLVGSALAAHLAGRGRAVVILDNAASGRPRAVEGLADVTWVRGDVTSEQDLNALPDLDWSEVYHLAAQADVPRSVQDPEADFACNATGTLRLLQWARRRQVGSLVYASTVAVYDPAARKPITEDAPLGPVSPYGASKLAGEALARVWHLSYGLPVRVLRLFNVYGPGMGKYVIHDLIRKLQRDPRRLEILGSGRQVRDYVHARDAARAFEVAAQAGRPGEVLNLGSGVPVTISELADRIITAMGLRDVEKVFTGRSWAGDVDAWYADTSRLAALGWRPGISLPEGLAETVASLSIRPAEGGS